MREWFAVLEHIIARGELDDLDRAWVQAKHVIQDTDNSVHSIRGLMSNVIFIISSAGWYPVAPTRWLDPENNLYALDENVSPNIVSALLIKAFIKKALIPASLGYDGKGMEGGVEFNASLAYTRNKAVDYPTKCTLEMIQAACMWPADRVHQIANSTDPICPRCKAAPETSLHCYWTCPCNAKIDVPVVAESQELIAEAVRGSVDFPCMWLRGILPSCKVYIPDEHGPTEELIIKFHNPPP